jgi:hypothetical protein
MFPMDVPGKDTRIGESKPFAPRQHADRYVAVYARRAFVGCTKYPKQDSNLQTPDPGSPLKNSLSIAAGLFRRFQRRRTSTNHAICLRFELLELDETYGASPESRFSTDCQLEPLSQLAYSGM